MVKASNILLIIVAIILPPAAVGFIAGCGCDFLINFCLTTLGFLPGHIHAYWLIHKKMQAEKRYGEGGFIYLGGGQYQARNDQPAPPV